MKKIKYIFISICALGILTYITMLGYPYTREMTLAFTQKCVEYLNQPLPIAGVSIVMIGGFLVNILDKSAWGRKQIMLANTIMNEITEKEKQYEMIIQEHKAQYEIELAHKQEEIEKLTNLLKEVCSNIKNKRVKELIEIYEREKTINTQTKEE